jgi:methylated-DNA-protein-cysteine methyltransferase-like protein
MGEKGFFDRIYEIVRQIPPGKITTYGAIARKAGSPQSSRMVGWALNKSFSEHEFVPAHRVVNRNGILSGKKYFPGQNTMAELLQNEGIEVKDDQIVNFKAHFWDPNQNF